MQILSSTPIVLALLLVLLWVGPYRGIAVLLGILPFGMMAAFNLPALGGTSIMASDMVVVTLICLTLLRRDVGKDVLTAFEQGSLALPLLGLLLYSILATLYFPRVFAGATEVFSLSRDANENGIASIPLRPTTGNLAQLFRIMLTMGAFLVVAVLVQRRPDPSAILKAMKFLTGIHVGLGLIDIATNAAGIHHLLQPIRTANYSLTLGQELAGLNRMIGGFPEASSFGYYALGLVGFWLSLWLSERSAESRDPSRYGPGFWLALSTFALLRCTSSSAYVGAAGFLIVFGIVQMRQRSVRMSVEVGWIIAILMSVIPLLIIGTYAAYSLVPSVTEFVDRSLLNKLSSDSGLERMSWNAQAVQNFLDTRLFGAGMGSVRASNWVMSTLATIGLPGMAFYLFFFYRLFTMPTDALDDGTARLVRAFKMGCLAFLMRAMVVHGSPNMGYGFFSFAGFVQGLVWATRQKWISSAVFRRHELQAAGSKG